VPPVLEFAVDMSGSMGKAPNASTTKSKWELTREALRSAVDGMSKDTTLGILTFPGKSSTVCNDIPKPVPLSVLGESASSQRGLVTSWLNSAKPSGDTPTHSAVRAGVQTLSAFTVKNGNSKFLVLITDGQPTLGIDCKNNPSSDPIVQEAQTAVAAGIHTFVIGSPGSENARSDLSRIAEAGGTAKRDCNSAGPNYCHFDLTQESDLGAALNKALAEISGTVLSCEIPIPDPPSGQTLDFAAINVAVTHAGSAKETIPQDTQEPCTTGWHFSADSKNIVLCPAACDSIKREANIQLAVELGCKTVVK
jgi:hypothetical protein